MTMCALVVSDNATKFFKEKVLGTDNSGCCFWWVQEAFFG